MKKAGLALALLALCVNFAISAPTTAIDPNMNMSGVWTNPLNSSWHIIISQDTHDVVVACNFYGGANKDIPVIWHGIGKAENGKVTYKMTYTVCPAGWEKTGTHELSVKENGNVLEGFSIDSKGARTPLKFVRKVIAAAQAMPK